MNVKGKKLLILGGPALACDIVKTAQEMGVYTMVTDWYTPEQMPAKAIADEYFMVSNADVDAVIDLIKEHRIDGVITGFTDSTLPYYQQICQKAGLPCYATAEQIGLTSHKEEFKTLCRKFNIPVVDEYEFSNGIQKKDSESITYPVLVKPTDNSGAKGISICNNYTELEKGYNNALSFSERKSVLVERYMDSEEVTIFYAIDNGEIYLTAMGDRHTKKNQSGVIPLPVAYTFPSVYLKKYISHLDEKVRKMFKYIGIQNGMIFIQSFVENGECIFYEMGFRLTGSLEHKLLNEVSGFNPLKMMINYSLTGQMDSDNLLVQSEPDFKKSAANITFLVKPGKIGEIKGVDAISNTPGFVYMLPSYKKGDVIPDKAKGTLQQVILRVFIVAESNKELVKAIDKVQNDFKVLSVDGENLLLEPFDVKSFIGNK